jgi:hypothetical protein
MESNGRISQKITMMNSPQKLLIQAALLFLAASVASACNRPVPTPATEPEAAVHQTAAALTVEAQLTSIASGNLPTTTPVPATPGAAQTPTQAPTAAPVTPTGTVEQPGDGTAETCDKAEFVSDVTIPDGTQFQPGESFDKTWLIKNTGTCDWDPNYSLVFVDGDSMDGPAAVTLTSTVVAPGGELEVTVTLTAPFVPGTYRGNWKFRNPSGALFGVGTDGNDDFWVEIEVVGETTPTAEE